MEKNRYDSMMNRIQNYSSKPEAMASKSPQLERQQIKEMKERAGQ